MNPIHPRASVVNYHARAAEQSVGKFTSRTELKKLVVVVVRSAIICGWWLAQADEEKTSENERERGGRGRYLQATEADRERGRARAREREMIKRDKRGRRTSPIERHFWVRFFFKSEHK